jgi:type I restriction enzyme, S subunit
MLAFMQMATLRGWLTNYTSQTSIAHLTREKLAEVNIILPSLPEQHRITECLASIDKMIDNEIMQKEKLQCLKIGLMQDLLSGNKLVDALLEQVESKHLEVTA